jgi:hypothetical protein
MTYDLTFIPPSCPICQQSDNVVPILYGLVELGEDGIAAVERAEFVLGGCCLRRENRFCKRCKHRFADPPEPPAPLPDWKPQLRAATDYDGDAPGKFKWSKFYYNGLRVTFRKAPPGKGYFLVVDYPDGKRIILHTDTRLEAMRMADMFGTRELLLEM